MGDRAGGISKIVGCGYWKCGDNEPPWFGHERESLHSYRWAWGR